MRERVKNSDFSGAASLPATNELQPKDRRPGKENKWAGHSTCKNRFQTDLELKEQVILVIVLIDRISGKAWIKVDDNFNETIA